jgi:hypothetical protein
MWNARLLLLALPFLAVLLGTSPAIQAQEWFGSITGTVEDEGGGVLPGVSVTISNQDTARVRNVTTDSMGAYRLTDVEPGRYTVRFDLSGFARSEMTGVMVQLGRTSQLSAILKVEGFIEAVHVMSEAPSLVDLSSTTVAHNVAAEEFDRLPKTRTFQSMAMTAASVNSGEIEGGIQVNGASAAENAFTIDGVMTNSLIHARSRQDAAFEYLQEVQVKTTGIDAEYGGALGGVVSAVTKSGGNRRQGEAHYYYLGSAISAAPVKRLVLSPIDDRTVTYVQDDKQPDHRNEVGGSLGGPIVRDRLFFFGAVSPQLIRRSNAYLFGNGTSDGTVAQRQTLTQAFGKITAVSRRVNVNGSVLYTPVRSTGTPPAYDGTQPDAIVSSGASNASNLARGFETSARTASANVDVMLSNRSFLTVRGGYFYDSYSDTGIPATTSVTYQTSNIGLAGVPVELQGPAGTQNTPRALVVDHDTTKRAFVSADYNHTFAAGGRHMLKAGVGFQRTTNDADAGYPQGYVFLFWGRTFSFGGTTGSGTYGYYEVQNRGFGGVASADMTSLYLQDQWAITDRLTVNLGLRTENEKIPTYRAELKKYGLQFGFGEKIAPRVGAVYDVNGNGRLKLYGSWGRYFDWTKYELARDSFGADFWTIRYRALDTLDIHALSLGNMPGTDLWIVPGSLRDQRVPNFDRMDAAIKPTYQDGTSIGLEYQIHPTSVLTAHYVHNDLRQVIDDVGSLVNGNSVLFIANPGEGNAALMPTSGPTAPFATPRVTRVYDALELGVARRLSSNWFATANYTYSRLYGNYSGLASSDEIRTPTTGASFKAHQQQSGSIANPGGSVNNAWNIDQLVWDAHGNLDVVGRLPTDRPHVVKLYGAYVFPFGTDLGLFFYGASGTPISTYVNTTSQAEVFVNGRGDMGRTPALAQTNLLLSQTLALGGAKLRLEVNVINLFNQKTTRHYFNFLNRGGGTARASSAMDLSRIDLAKGYDYDALIRSTPDGTDAYDPRYGLADLFNEGLQGRIMMKLIF